MKRKICKRIELFIYIITLAFFVNSTVEALDSSDVSWRWSNPSPHGNDINDFMVVSGTGIQVGELGNIFWSSNLQGWNNVNVGDENSLRCITVFNGNYYIGSETGTIYITEDFENFSVVDLGTDDWIEGISASASLIVAVGDNGSIFTSSDGTQWTQRNSGTEEWLRDIQFGGNRFIAVGENGTIVSSFNGAAWSVSQVNTSENLNSIANDGANKFAVAGDAGVVFTTTNGATWTSLETNSNADILTVSYGGDTFLLAGENIAFSVNSAGLVTSETDSETEGKLPEYLWQSSAYENGIWYLAGSAGLNYSGSVPSDGISITWATEDDSLRNWIWDMQAVDNQLFAVGDFGTILVSSDGISWDSRIVPEEATNKLILSITGTNEGLIAAGVDGLVLFSPSELISSEETETIDGQEVKVVKELLVPGINWNMIEIPGINQDLKGSVFHEGFYYLCGESGILLRSSNGTQWDTLDSGTSEFLSGVSGKGESLIAVGRAGTVLKSENKGDSWMKVNSFTSDWLLQIRCLNDKFFAVGEGGAIASSNDGVTWVLADTPSSTAFINDVTFHEGMYYASGTLGRVWQSANGDVWESLPTNTGKSLYTLSPFDGRLVVAGIEGAIIRTPFERFIDPIAIQAFQKVESGGQEYFGFLLQGKTDQYFNLDFSNNLSGPWESFVQHAEIKEADGTVSVLMPVTDDPDSIFFRIEPSNVE